MGITDHIRKKTNTTRLERETGIEPASLAWKARVLPLNYSRSAYLPLRAASHADDLLTSGGGGWIRTSVGVSQQIYSLPPLATRAPLQRTLDCSRKFPASTTPLRYKPTTRWRGWRGSNPRPLASEANTLSTELQPPRCEPLRLHLSQALDYRTINDDPVKTFNA